MGMVPDPTPRRRGRSQAGSPAGPEWSPAFSPVLAAAGQRVVSAGEAPPALLIAAAAARPGSAQSDPGLPPCAPPASFPFPARGAALLQRLLRLATLRANRKPDALQALQLPQRSILTFAATLPLP